MDEKTFHQLTKKLYERVMRSFEDFDPDEAEADFHLDNVAVTLLNKTKFVVNRQPPVRQIWLATKRQGLHFNYDAGRDQWICDKSGREFYEVFDENVSEVIGRPFRSASA